MGLILRSSSLANPGDSVTVKGSKGANTLTAGVGSHAEGINTSAIGIASHAGGYGTVASGSYQTAIGI